MQKNKRLSKPKSVDAVFLFLIKNNKPASIAYIEYILTTVINGNIKRDTLSVFE